MQLTFNPYLDSVNVWISKKANAIYYYAFYKDSNSGIRTYEFLIWNFKLFLKALILFDL